MTMQDKFEIKIEHLLKYDKAVELMEKEEATDTAKADTEFSKYKDMIIYMAECQEVIAEKEESIELWKKCLEIDSFDLIMPLTSSLLTPSRDNLMHYSSEVSRMYMTSILLDVISHMDCDETVEKIKELNSFMELASKSKSRLGVHYELYFRRTLDDSDILVSLRSGNIKLDSKTNNLEVLSYMKKDSDWKTRASTSIGHKIDVTGLDLKEFESFMLSNYTSELSTITDISSYVSKAFESGKVIINNDQARRLIWYINSKLDTYVKEVINEIIRLSTPMRRDMIERKISTALVENIARIVDRGRLLVLLITPYIKYKSYKKQFKECCDKLYQSAEDINNYINDDTIDKVFNTIIDKNILTEYVLEYSDIVAEIAGIFDDSINEIESKKSERKSKNESREIDNE